MDRYEEDYQHGTKYNWRKDPSNEADWHGLARTATSERRRGTCAAYCLERRGAVKTVNTGTLAVVCIVIIACLLGSASFAIEEKKVEWKQITRVAQTLAREYQVRIGLEECVPLEGPRSANPRRKAAPTRAKNIVVRPGQEEIGQVLDRVIAAEPDYVWQHDKATESFNIFPKKDAPLSFTMNGVELHNVTFREIFIEGDLLGLKKQDIQFNPGWGNYAWLESRVSLKVDGGSARLIMNRICSQLPYKARWELRRTYYGRRLIGLLAFEGLGIFPGPAPGRTEMTRSRGPAAMPSVPPRADRDGFAGGPPRPSNTPGTNQPGFVVQQTVEEPRPVSTDTTTQWLYLVLGFGGAVTIGAVGAWRLKHRKVA